MQLRVVEMVVDRGLMFSDIKIGRGQKCLVFPTIISCLKFIAFSLTSIIGQNALSEISPFLPDVQSGMS